MKLQIVSDLHLEFWPKQPDFIGFEPAPDADALVIAGDIAVGLRAHARFQSWPVPVLYICGNHEFYDGRELGNTVRQLREECAGTNVHFMEKDMVVLPGFADVRFLGTTLWTDYLMFGRDNQALSMFECEQTLSDHDRIRSQGRRFRARDAMFRHVASKAWLREQLALPFDGKSVVVSHHGCHWGSVGAQWKKDLVTGGFSSDMTELLEHADLWIHGHTHESFDYQVGRARTVVNPRGYPMHNGSFEGRPMRSGAYENPDFNPQLIIEV